VGERILAVRQPDHTIEYSDFEGTIPDGNMGAGTVKRVFDRKVDVLKSNEDGLHLRVYPESSGLPQDFVLIDTGHAKNGWLFIQKEYKPLERVEKHAFKVKPDEQLRALEDEQRFIAEVKVDGSHELIHVTENGLRLASHRISKRTGKVIEHSDKVPHLRDQLGKAKPGTLFHGEIFHDDGANFTAGILNSNVERAREIQKQHGPMKVKVFDIARFEGESVEHLPYHQRMELAKKVIEQLDNPHIHYVRGTRSNFREFYNRVNAGKEFRYQSHPTDGIVVKDLNAPYKNGPWLKVKPTDEHDLTVVDSTEELSILGVPKGALGALIVETPDGKLVNVGTGFTRAQRQWLWKHRAELPGEVVKVKFHERKGQPWTGPRFEGLHPGKSDLAGVMEAESL
jgi:bifunctional non-homologous end joining protein LigD